MTDLKKAIEEAKAAIMPYESWKQLKNESTAAYAAFCTYREIKDERNIRKASGNAEPDESNREKQYRSWRDWAAKYRWRERAADYDRYKENLKQEEYRKTIEAQGEKQRQVTGKMLDVVIEKLNAMNPNDLTQSNLTEWVQVAIKSEREAAGLIAPNGKTESKQGELNFVSDFEGL